MPDCPQIVMVMKMPERKDHMTYTRLQGQQ